MGGEWAHTQMGGQRGQMGPKVLFPQGWLGWTHAWIGQSGAREGVAIQTTLEKPGVIPLVLHSPSGMKVDTTDVHHQPNTQFGFSDTQFGKEKSDERVLKITFRHV